ncbi:nuclear pore complex protein [Niveomyces insectorum RCEF 264]|uniref:Nuclear pore complex protein n=1 Tax=Niveomyces insectorum RCEF 264 TaxID=1081102 RepID=A0A167X1S6_9HYPO|nr:nuclear pore complex protein [Niveomyces insectorum RCEF 264]
MASQAVTQRPPLALRTPPRQTTAAAASGPFATTTPKTTTTPTRAADTDSPGNWQHPRLDEITRRRAASVFGESNLKTVVYNGLAWGFVFLARTATGMPFKQVTKLAHDVVPAQYIDFVSLTLQAVFAFNIVCALLPLFRQTDNLTDVPLTPGQRKLLGLPAVKAPATPDAVYSTPPRYTRTPSLSGSVTSLGTAANNKPSANGKNSGGKGGPFASSPISTSPLFFKAKNGSNGGGGGSSAVSPFSPGSALQSARRASFGSPKALASGGGGIGLGGTFSFPESALSGVPGTSSPSSGKRLSMGLNNKWLYEKGRRSSSGARVF